MENSLIGELQLVQHSQIGTSWHLIWEEFYQEQATGTRISVICSGQGHTRYCTIRYGSVFTRTADGEIVLTDTRPLLEEAEAIRIAHVAVEEAFAERDFTQTLLPEKTVCTLKANEDGRFYCVEVFSSIEELPYEGNYQVILDPYDGTVQEVARNN